MKTRYTLFLSTALLVCCCTTAFSQMVGDNIFLQGAFVEIGIAPNGGFGSTLNAPAGYHPNNPGDFFYDPAAGTATSLTSNLGFVADYGADGWTVGTPPYFGDFYLPGTPQEGWAIEVNGEEADAYIPSYQSDPSTGYTGFGGITVPVGTGLSGTNVLYSNSGGVIKGLWQGTDVTSSGTLAIRQTTILDTTKLYFTVNVVLTNTSATTMNNIYYLRTLDPDNDETYSGDYTTINTIVNQLPNPTNKVLVSATGTVYTNAFIGLGTKDCRAKCMIFSGTLAPEYSLDSLYNYPAATGYTYGQGDVYTQDVGIGLSYALGSLAPGDSTTLTYAYILNAAYIDSALNATEPVYVVNLVAHDSSDTINVCTYPYDSVAVNIQNGGFYHWSWAPDSFLQSPSGPNNVIYSDSVTNFLTYTITGTNAAGGCDSVVFYLTIEHAVAPGPIVPPVSYCQDAVADTLTAPGGGQTWWTAATGGTGSPVPPTPSTAVAGTFIYYVSEVNGLCETERSPDTVTIIPLPAAPFITDPTPYCEGQTFVPFTTAGSGILWYTGPTGGVGNPAPPVINTGIPGTTVNYASQTVNGCEGPRGSFAVTVLDSIIPAFTYDLLYGCTADTVVFINSSTGAAHYAWTFGDGGNDTLFDPQHVYLTQGTFTVTLVASNGGCAQTATDTININHSVIASFTADPDIVCQQSPVNFTSTSTGVGLSYLWNFGNGVTANTANTSYTYNNTGSYDVTLVVTDFVPCHDTVTQTVYVDTMSGISLGLTDTVICQGTYITFTGLFSNIGNTGVTWYFGNGDSIRNVDPVSYVYPTPGIWTASVTAYYRACKDTGASRTVIVRAQPLINLGPDTSICPGSGVITLADNINVPPATWLWNTGQTTAAITVNNPGVYVATVNLDNCYATDSVVVLSDCYMNVPNVFTPNNDGVNDYFYPRQFLTKGLTSFKMDIYNRWGQQIFETSSLDGAGWDGKLNNIDQPEGVYIYVIDGTFKDGQKEHHQGNLTLLR